MNVSYREHVLKFNFTNLWNVSFYSDSATITFTLYDRNKYQMHKGTEKNPTVMIIRVVFINTIIDLLGSL